MKRLTFLLILITIPCQAANLSTDEPFSGLKIDALDGRPIIIIDRNADIHCGAPISSQQFAVEMERYGSYALMVRALWKSAGCQFTNAETKHD